LNYYENLAVGVNFDVFDITVVNALVGGRVIAAWSGYESFVRGRRAAPASDQIWITFEGLAARLVELPNAAPQPVSESKRRPAEGS
jgi:hypothetical protein